MQEVTELKRQINLFFLFLIVLCLTGCSSGSGPQAKKAEKKPVQTDTQITSAKTIDPNQPQYFFINGNLVGSLVKDKWYSSGGKDDSFTDATDFFVKDILSPEQYFIYQNREYVGISKQILWTVYDDGGLGSFEGEDTAEKLFNYSMPLPGEDEESRVFNLPVKAGQELADIVIPSYSFYTRFLVDKKVVSPFDLATNRKINPFPRKITQKADITSEGKQALVDLFAKNQMGNTAPNFTDCVKSDFDNDGHEEFLMAANSPVGELGYPLPPADGKMEGFGVFSVVLYQEDDGSVQIIYSDLRPIKVEYDPDPDRNKAFDTLGCPDYCMEIRFSTIADLNSDGIYEIALKEVMWEWGADIVYAMDSKGAYQAVMRANWGQ